MIKERLDHPTFSMENYITKLSYEEMIKEYLERSDVSEKARVRISNSLPSMEAKKKLAKTVWMKFFRNLEINQRLATSREYLLKENDESP